MANTIIMLSCCDYDCATVTDPCCVVCCMYPALGYEEFFGFDDLPDELNITVEGQEYTAQKGATPYGIYYWPEVGRNITFDEGQWQWGAQDDPDPEFGFIGLGPAECLIDDPLAVSTVTHSDNFADTYSVDIDYANIGNWEAWIREVITVSRVSLCEWRGFDSCGRDVVLYYNSIDGTAFGTPTRLAEWYVEFNTNTNYEGSCGEIGISDTWIIKKELSANSPAGEYGDYPATEESAGGAIVS